MSHLTLVRPIIEIDQWKIIPRYWQGEENLDMNHLRATLTIENKGHHIQKKMYKNTKKPERIRAYIENEQTVKVPRFFDPKFKKMRALDVWEEHEYRKVSFSHRKDFKFRKGQQEVYDKMRKYNGGIVSLSCGKGKTVLALRYISDLTHPVIIVVHTQDLMEQWREQIEHFLGIPREEIGHIQGQTIKFKGCRIAVGMLKTLAMGDYTKEVTTYFGTIFFDEAHNFAAEQMSAVLPIFTGQRHALTATVNRFDGMEKLLFLHVGVIIHKDLTQDLVPEVYFLRTPLVMPARRWNIETIITDLAKSDKRNEFILSVIEKCLDSGRNLLVLGTRVEQLKLLHDHCDCPSKGLITGAEKDLTKRRNYLTKRVCFATAKLAKEGLDRPNKDKHGDFDTLIVLAPQSGESFIQQSIGRIQRLHPKKKAPKVFFMFDEHVSELRKKCQSVMRVLRKMKFNYKVA